jgi:hypothetical protein
MRKFLALAALLFVPAPAFAVDPAYTQTLPSVNTWSVIDTDLNGSGHIWTEGTVNNIPTGPVPHAAHVTSRTLHVVAKTYPPNTFSSASDPNIPMHPDPTAYDGMGSDSHDSLPIPWPDTSEPFNFTIYNVPCGPKYAPVPFQVVFWCFETKTYDNAIPGFGSVTRVLKNVSGIRQP